jgi:hypothetical protein
LTGIFKRTSYDGRDPSKARTLDRSGDLEKRFDDCHSVVSIANLIFARRIYSSTGHGSPSQRRDLEKALVSAPAGVGKTASSGVRYVPV